MIYQWKDNHYFAVPAQVAGEELERIRTLRNGRLDKKDVLEEARDPDSPIHPVFEWDDEAAAEAYRLGQAGDLIRSIEVVIEESPDTKPIRAFVSVVRDADRSYTSVAHAFADPKLRRQVLLQALKELEAWRSRHAELVELAKVFAAIDEARDAK